MIIGITGSFGTGKTKISKIFKKYKYKVINVDNLYAKILRKNLGLRRKLKKEFGTSNRKKLRNIVFKNKEKLNMLNTLTHPRIIKEIKKLIANYQKINKNQKIIIDAPLLIESQAINLVDKIIVVKCSKKEQTSRILKKKKYKKAEIINIIKSQMPIKEKLKYADFVIDNSHSMGQTKEQVLNVIKALKN